ncbi:Solute-binding protein [bacterium HR40]|nr:Solute-binding protein [bacterium HR40]
MPKRRELLRAAAVGTAVFGFPAVLRSQATIVLKLSHYLPTAHGLHRDFMEPWARELEQRTGGAVKVEIFPGGTQLGNVAKQYDQVRAGIVDIAHGLHGIPAGRFPRTSIVDLPFLTESADAASRALWALHERYFAEEYPDVKVLAVHAHNGGLVHTRAKQVTRMEDLRGLRIRFPSAATKMMLEQLGAIPVGLPPAQIYESLQKGVIDGLVMPWDPMHSFKLAELIDYHLDARCYTVSFYFVMNQRRYDSLPAEVRAAIDSLSGESLVAKFGPWWNAWDELGRRDSLADGGQVTRLSDEERGRWREALEPMIDAYIADLERQGIGNAREIYDALQAKVAEFERT